MQKEKLFRGFAHCHSNISYDAKLSYPQLRDTFMQQGLDFVCMTEHIEKLKQADIDKIIHECRSNSDNEFLFIPGIEMDVFVIYFLGIKPLAVDFTSSRTVFDSLHQNARLCIFSHPIKASYTYPSWLIELCDGVEIWNTRHDGNFYPRKQSLKLLSEVKKTRKHALALAGMDFHKKTDLSAANFQLNTAGELTEQFVLEQIANGNYTIYKNDIPTDSITAIKKQFYWFVIFMMDNAHLLHKFITNKGMTIPKPIKKIFRILLEGK